MPEQDKSLMQRVVHRVRWAKHDRIKAMVRTDYVLVPEPLLAEEIGKALRQMD